MLCAVVVTIHHKLLTCLHRYSMNAYYYTQRFSVDLWIVVIVMIKMPIASWRLCNELRRQIELVKISMSCPEENFRLIKIKIL